MSWRQAGRDLREFLKILGKMFLYAIPIAAAVWWFWPR